MRPNRSDVIPVIDLFAGPGGLGEGFSAFTGEHKQHAFRIALSIEKDDAAHSTLELRRFFRQFAPGDVPNSYYLHLRGLISRDKLFADFPVEATAAKEEAWKAELGVADATEVDRRIKRAIGGSEDWVLCGGPPCQAYSVIGRSRNQGINAKDDKLYLYKEYLRILSEHRPPVFIMENVKGILSSKVGRNEIFKQMLTDLRQPATALRNGHNGNTRYFLYSLACKPSVYDLYGDPEFQPGEYVIPSENYGIPQSRHRVIILGIREDLADCPVPILQPADRRVPASHVLNGLPRLRSGLTRTSDGKSQWRGALSRILGPRILDDIPNGKGSLLRREISGTLEKLRTMRADRGGEFVPCDAKTQYEKTWYCDPKIGGVCNHTSRPHMEADLHRYLFAVCYAKLNGRSPELRDFPPRLLPKHSNVRDKDKREYFDDRFRVQLADRPSTTVTCHLSKDGHYFIHFDETQCRSMTVREAARLQTFPDNYVFCGTRTQQYIQVGNAVPPLLARQIAGVVMRILRADQDKVRYTLTASARPRQAVCK
ncbi:MAG: DNA cytosine methyltransferase [Terriglobia bacterium]